MRIEGVASGRKGQRRRAGRRQARAGRRAQRPKTGRSDPRKPLTQPDVTRRSGAPRPCPHAPRADFPGLPSRRLVLLPPSLSRSLARRSVSVAPPFFQLHKSFPFRPALNFSTTPDRLAGAWPPSLAGICLPPAGPSPAQPVSRLLDPERISIVFRVCERVREARERGLTEVYFRLAWSALLLSCSRQTDHATDAPPPACPPDEPPPPLLLVELRRRW